MDSADIVKFVLMVGIMLTVTSVGLRSQPADTLLLLRNPRLGIRAMVSMFLLMPLFVIGMTSVMPPIVQATHAALIALSVSPMPPILPRRQLTVGAGGDYAVGLQVLASVFSIIIAPVFIWLAGRLQGVATVFDVADMLRVLAVTIGAPLAAGILIARVWPRFSVLSNPLARVSLVFLVAGGAFALVAEAPEIISQVGHGVLLAIVAVVLFGLLAGHLLGGPDAGNRGALALATSARHPGLAITLSATAFPHDKHAIIATVLLYLLANVVLTLPYAVWRRLRVLRSKT